MKPIFFFIFTFFISSSSFADHEESQLTASGLQTSDSVEVSLDQKSFYFSHFHIFDLSDDYYEEIKGILSQFNEEDKAKLRKYLFKNAIWESQLPYQGEVKKIRAACYSHR